MKNLEKYINSFSSKESLDCAIRAVRENSVNCDGVSNGCKKCRAENLKWLNEEYVEPILTESEKAYLSAVIVPYTNKLLVIKKHGYENGEECIIIASLDSERLTEQTIQDGKNILKKWAIYLPEFKEGTMYQKMEREKIYTLEELGL